MTYEEIAKKECLDWQRKMMKKSGMVSRAAKKVQVAINNKIPEAVHRTMTEAIKKITQAALLGSKWTTQRPPAANLSLKERETLIQEKIKTYKRVAAVEGAGTGAGGFWLSLADFPALLSIKMKFLFEAATLYGFDVKDQRERLFILYVFLTAFSSDEKRQDAFLKLKNWEQYDHHPEMDWYTFQQEYRDTIDLAKLLQLVPGLGAAVGAFANYRFLDHLGNTAMNAYRMRIFRL
ncbi:EcsC family protein [Tuberibacillus calidus]|uniref:EcsC family protein n=1 Tax=Tuberibacillus calidus TaxID=340097 RepID=UPI00041995B3|nr:EcsC family protein [Tuberibacillus calidus]